MDVPPTLPPRSSSFSCNVVSLEEPSSEQYAQMLAKANDKRSSWSHSAAGVMRKNATLIEVSSMSSSTTLMTSISNRSNQPLSFVQLRPKSSSAVRPSSWQPVQSVDQSHSAKQKSTHHSLTDVPTHAKPQESTSSESKRNGLRSEVSQMETLPSRFERSSPNASIGATKLGINKVPQPSSPVIPILYAAPTPPRRCKTPQASPHKDKDYTWEGTVIKNQYAKQLRRAQASVLRSSFSMRNLSGTLPATASFMSSNDLHPASSPRFSAKFLPIGLNDSMSSMYAFNNPNYTDINHVNTDSPTHQIEAPIVSNSPPKLFSAFKKNLESSEMSFSASSVRKSTDDEVMQSPQAQFELSAAIPPATMNENVVDASKSFILHSRQRSAEEVECDVNTARLARHLPDPQLISTLASTDNSPLQYLSEFVVQENGLNSAFSSNRLIDASQDGMNGNGDLCSILLHLKECVRTKHKVLLKDRDALDSKVKLNGVHGQRVRGFVLRRCGENASVLRRLDNLTEQLDYSPKLLCLLSCKLARVDKKLSQLSRDAEATCLSEIEMVERNKRCETEHRLNEAKLLQANIDVCQENVANSLRGTLTNSEFDEFVTFVQQKSSLHLQRQQIEEAISDSQILLEILDRKLRDTLPLTTSLYHFL